MSKTVKIRKGVDIKLKGEAEKVFATAEMSDTFAIKPPDFHGLTPKLAVKAGDEVKAGQILFYDKYNERVKFASPVSGEVAEIVRGAKRKIMEVRILADKETKYQEGNAQNVGSMSREQVVETLLNAGLWGFVRQRPYDIIANPDETPKSIFISAFDSAPLGVDNDFVVRGQEAEFQTGLDAVAKLTSGKVHLQVNNASSAEFTAAKGVQVNRVDGPHPAGLVGPQIHHIDPINKGERVWTLNIQDVITIGRYFSTGKFDASRVVAVAGSQVDKPRYVKAVMGTSIAALTNGSLKSGPNRIISGNVLTGEKVAEDGYLGFYHYMVSVIPEDEEMEFFGWIAPGFNKFSLSRTFFSWLTPNKKYALGTSQQGEHRAFVMSGQYDKVFPMDVLPVYLIKAIMVGDIELMENLGIYEVAPEDFALCEFACTSKTHVQEIVRGGLDLVHKECG